MGKIKSPLVKVYRAIPNDFYDFLLDLVKDHTRVSVHIRLALTEFEKEHVELDFQKMNLPSTKRTFYITKSQNDFINQLANKCNESKTVVTQNAIYHYLKRRGYHV